MFFFFPQIEISTLYKHLLLYINNQTNKLEKKTRKKQEDEKKEEKNTCNVNNDITNSSDLL